MIRTFCILSFIIVTTVSTAQVFLKTTKAPAEIGKPSWASSWGDYDNDGDFDLYVCNYLDKNFLYKNNGNGAFTKITTAPLNTLATSTFGHWSSTWVDYDNDKDLDLYVTNSYTDNGELFRNNGNGTFTSVSSPIANTSTVDDNNAAWADTDNDGDLDLFLSNGSNASDETRNQNNSYYINNGNGTFSQNTSSIISTDGGFSQFGTFGDYDDDGDADLLVINTFQNSFFYENNGNGSFSKITNVPFLSIGEQPLTACWADFNNDGYLDLVTGSYDRSRVYFNNGDKTFHVGTLPGLSGNATGVSVGDFDLDGDQDVIFIRAGQAALYYQNNGNETFTNTNAGDLTSVTLDYTNSGAIADFDNDGDLDVYINNDNSKNLLLENTEVSSNWIAFKLNGIASNWQGVGAKVKIKINGHWQMIEVGVLSSYRAQNSILAHFGVANATEIDLARIEWPSGNVQIIRNVGVNQILTVTEDNSPDSPHSLNPTLNGTEDELLSFHLSDFKNAFIDEDGDRLKSIKVTTLPLHGQLFLNELPVEIGQIIPVKNVDAVTFFPEENFNGAVTFLYSSIDRRNLEVIGTVTINLEPVNDVPSILPIQDVLKNVLKIGDPLQIEFNVNDIDTDPNELQFTATLSDETVSQPQNISFSGSANSRILSLVPARGGTSEITISVSDGELESSTTFTLTINFPHLINLALAVNEDEKLQFSTQQFIGAFVDQEGDQLMQITIKQLPDNGVLQLADQLITAGQQIQVSKIDDITFLPVQNFNGMIALKLSSEDFNGLSVDSDLPIQVNAVNDPPTIEPIGDIVKDLTANDKKIQIPLKVNDVDNAPSSLVVTALADNKGVIGGEGIAVKQQENNPFLAFQADNAGEANLTVRVSDLLSTTEISFKLIINITTGVFDNNAEGFTIYPNPITDKLNLFIGKENENMSYTISDYLGRIVQSGQVTAGINGDVSIDTKSISSGIFVFRFVVNNKTSIVKVSKE